MPLLLQRIPIIRMKLKTFQVYIIGGDGTQKGASVIFEVVLVCRQTKESFEIDFKTLRAQYSLSVVWLFIKHSSKQEIRRRGLKVSVVGIPKNIDNDIPVSLFLLELLEHDSTKPIF